MKLPYASYVDAIAEEASRLADAAGGHEDVSVPTCPGWRISDLLTHLGAVYQRFFDQLAASDQSARVASVAPSEVRAEALEALASDLADRLASLGPDAPCWNFTGSDFTTAFAARRLAHESAVHRVDVELAVGDVHPIEAELALDGIAERFEVFLTRLASRVSDVDLGGSLCLVPTDADAAFRIESTHGKLRWSLRRGPADAVVVGTASDLLLFSWNRLGIAELEVTGEDEVAQAFFDTMARA